MSGRDQATVNKVFQAIENQTIARKLAIVIRFSQMAPTEDRGCMNNNLEALCWLGLEDLLYDALAELETIEHLADSRIGFVTRADRNSSGDES